MPAGPSCGRPSAGSRRSSSPTPKRSRSAPSPTSRRAPAPAGPPSSAWPARLGYDGFVDLQSGVQAELARRLRPAAERIRQPPASDVVGRTLAVELDNVQATLERSTARRSPSRSGSSARARGRVLVVSGDASHGDRRPVRRRPRDAARRRRPRRRVRASGGPGDRPRRRGRRRRRDGHPPLRPLGARHRRGARRPWRHARRRSPTARSRRSPAGRQRRSSSPPTAPGPFDSHVGLLALANALVAGVAGPGGPARRTASIASSRPGWRPAPSWTPNFSACPLATRRMAWSARSTTSRRRPGSRCSGPAGRPPTPPSPPAPCSPSRPSTCAAWAATCSRSCTTRRRARRPCSTRPGGPAAGADPDRLRAEGHTVDAVPRRHPGGAGARVRRRLAGAARTVRPAAAGRRPRPRDRLRPRRVPGVAAARRLAHVRRRRRARRRLPRRRPHGPRSARSCAGPASRTRSRPSWSGGRDGFYEGPVRSGAPGAGRGRVHHRRPAPRQRRLGGPAVGRVWDHDVWTIPPNSQGYLTLLGAAIADGLDLPTDPADGLWAHLLVEAARAAGHDRPAVLHEHADVAPLLDAGRRRRPPGRHRPRGRARCSPSPAAAGGTIYLCAVDGDRMGVSLIQSNASGFGAGIVEPSTGIFLQNRGHRVLPRARPPGRVRARAGGRRTRSPPRWSPGRTGPCAR